MNGGYYAIRQELHTRIREAVPGYVQILTGPRQVGKTTLLLEIAEELGENALFLAADSPEASLPEWWSINWQQAIRMARRHSGVLLIDEVHGLPEWSRLIKTAYDEIKRTKLPLQIIISGSSSLQLSDGTRETMAGRFERLHLRHWTARDLMQAFALSEHEAATMIVRFGAFPGGIPLLDSTSRWKAYIRDAIVDPAIGTDILMLHQVRRPALLRQILAICMGHPSEILSLQKIAGSLTEAGNLTTIAEYLSLLESAYLATALPKFASSEVRRRATPPKLVPLSNALLALGTPGDPPSPETDPRHWGHWLENACIATAHNEGHSLTYWREQDAEVDMVINDVGCKWAIEIKGGDFTPRDLTGLMTFVGRHSEYRPLVIGNNAYRDAAVHTGIPFLPWQEYLLNGLPE